MRAAWLLILVAASGCFYLDGVNVPPVARIDRPAGPYHVGDMVTLSAITSTDDQPATLSFDWSAVCQGCLEQTGNASQFAVTIGGHDTVRVTVAVFDANGASGTASVDLAVTNLAPTLKVQAPGTGAQGTFPVGAPIAIAAAVADPDDDKTTVTAVVHPPAASDPNRVSFTKAGDAGWTLVPDVPGHWEVMVTAADGYGGSTVATQGLEVAADAPPCIAATTPAAPPDARYVLQTSDAPRRFAVDSVQDDLDPWPAVASTLQFRWSVDGVEVAGHDLSDLIVDPADHQPGDTVTLRVEIADRVARTLPCAPEQPQCSIGGDACLQRVTWTVEIR